MNTSGKSNYNKSLKHFTRNLRNKSTSGEIVLWKDVLGNRKMYGLQFFRQYPIVNYIVDFIYRKIRLVIETGGYSHNNRFEQDLIRDLRLKELGCTPLRFEEQKVYKDLNNVIRAIEWKIEELLGQSPLPPLPRGRAVI